MELYDVVKKLLGPIAPVGKTEVDEQRFNNMNAAFFLINALLADIEDVAHYKDCEEYSRSRAGKRADQFLKDIKEA